jgi:hypothetical protein
VGGDYEHGRDFVADLDTFLGKLPKGWPYAVEMRNKHWLAPEYFSCLARHGIAHVFNSWDAMPPSANRSHCRVEHRKPLLTVNEEPDISISGIVRRQNLLRMAQQVFAVRSGSPNQEAPNGQLAGNAVEQVARSARVPDEFPLDFRHSKNGLVAKLPKLSDCVSFYADAFHNELRRSQFRKVVLHFCGHGFPTLGHETFVITIFFEDHFFRDAMIAEIGLQFIQVRNAAVFWLFGLTLIG